MASEALRMVIKLEVDESLLQNYKQYQDNNNDNNNIDNNNNNQSCIFPECIKMFPWNDIQQITQYIYEQTKIAPTRQRLFFRGREITSYNKMNKKSKKNHKLSKLSSPTLSFFGITHGSSIYLQCNSASNLSCIVPYGRCSVLLSSCKSSDINSSLISESIIGLNLNYKPILAADGEGGTYFLLDKNKNKIACFKPRDEEAGCINNPRGHILRSQAMNKTIKPSKGHLREIGAYLIDTYNNKYNGFHNVPPTIRVEIINNNKYFNVNNGNITGSSGSITGSGGNIAPKIGALQQFIAGEVIENFGIKNFSQREIHKIGILDIRLLNSDRNTGNIIVSKDKYNRYTLVPIDHGLSLPNKLEITRDSWIWLNWEQSKQPFDPYTIKFINDINVEDDINLLYRELNINRMAFEYMRISDKVLKKGINYGLTLNDIGNIIARPDFDIPSILEKLIEQAEILAEEKARQNKHFINRLLLKKYKQKQRHLSMKQLHNNLDINQANNIKSITPKPEHIYHKFVEKGKTLKNPLMNYQPSLAPPGSSSGSGSKIINKLQYQVVNTNNHKNSNVSLTSSPPLPVASVNSINSINSSLSPFPGQLLMSTSLGSGRNITSMTPEPLSLNRIPSLISSNTNSNSNSTSGSSNKAIILITNSSNKTDDDIIKLKPKKSVNNFGIVWTPKFRPSKSQKSNPNQFRSLTPDRNVNDGMVKNVSLYDGDNDNDDDKMADLQLSTPPNPFKQNNNNNNSIIIMNSNSNSNTNTSSIHKMHKYVDNNVNILDDDDDDNDNEYNIILKSLSINTDTDTTDQTDHDTPQHTPPLHTHGLNANDIDPTELFSNVSTVVPRILSINENNPQNDIDDPQNNSNNNSNIIPFSSIKLDKSLKFESITTMKHSQSCVAVKNASNSSKSLSSFSLLSKINNKFNNIIKHKNDDDIIDSDNDSSTLKSKDCDSVFLYGNPSKGGLSTSSLNSIKSASLIAHPSMLKVREQQNNNLLQIAIDNGPDSPSTPSNHVSTPSNKSQSQDDNIRQPNNNKIGGSGSLHMHSILQRMSSEKSLEIRQFFFNYLDQLLSIQCERISNRAKKQTIDKHDDIYDVDTVNGSFIWKNELRKHWIRSRLERKKLLQSKQKKTNPYDVNDKENDNKKINNKNNNDNDDDDDDNQPLPFFNVESIVDYDADPTHFKNVINNNIT